ncbi:MAG: type II toxin-antitoxin system HicB family antitoxin [Syntrophobacteraceae bacterium]|nr:type II toxin-antitoxin system HicB family antitoxin [Syntrophobacteraceae bacterium]
MNYPVTLTTDPETGQVMAAFPDLPGALTVGKDKTEAMNHALGALITALSGYIDSGRQIPAPSSRSGQAAVSLPALVCAKLALYEAMRRRKVTRAALAEKLGVDPRQVRRLLDLNHRSRMDQVETALKALGQRLVVSAKEAA